MTHYKPGRKQRVTRLTRERSRLLLVVNGGSSSIKFALFPAAAPGQKIASGKVERIGLAGATLTVRKGNEIAIATNIDARDHRKAIHVLLDWLDSQDLLKELGLVAHGVVHGEPDYSESDCI